MPTRLNRFLQRRLLRSILTVAAIVAMLLATWRYRLLIATICANADLGLLGVSILLGLLANYLTGLPFNSFLRQYGIEISAGRACYLQLVVQVTKYIPGNIWGAILQAQLIGSQRVGAIFLAGIDTTVFFMLTVSTTGLALLACGHHPVAAVLIAATGWALAVVIASSTWLFRFVGTTARLLGKHLPVNPAPPLGHEIGHLFTWAFLHAVLYTGSVITLLIATTHFTFNDILIGATSIFLAWVIGTVAVVVPSGLGVRELAFVSLATALGASATPQSLAAIAIVARVAQTAPDIFAAVIVALVESTNAIRGRLQAKAR